LLPSRQTRNLLDNCGQALRLKHADLQRNIERMRNSVQVESRLLMQETQQLWSVESALKRLAEGTYGRCGLCQCEISAKRLLKTPWEAHCATCAKLAEAGVNSGPHRA